MEREVVVRVGVGLMEACEGVVCGGGILEGVSRDVLCY